MKKTRVQKSHATVPLSGRQYLPILMVCFWILRKLLTVLSQSSDMSGKLGHCSLL